MTPYYYITINGKTIDGRRYKTQREAEKVAWIAATNSNGANIEICRCIAVTKLTTPATFWMDGEEPSEI